MLLDTYHIDPLLGNDSEISKDTRPLLSNGLADKRVPTETIELQ
jgi:hypothetical protein